MNMAKNEERADDAATMCVWCEQRVQGACKSHYDTLTCTHRVIAPTAEEWDSAIEARAAELHEGCRMPMEQARELAASEAAPDWYARGQDWGLADALTNGQSGEWVLDDIARAFAAGASAAERAGRCAEALPTEVEQARKTAEYWKTEHLAGNVRIGELHDELAQTALRSVDHLRKAIKAEAKVEAMQARQAELVAVLARMCELNAAERPMARVWAAAQALVDSHTSRALGPNVELTGVPPTDATKGG